MNSKSENKMAKNSKKNYFTQETEEAIILYNNTSDHAIKSKIYGEKIHYPFFKLTQNIIHTFKFYHTEVDDLEHLQHEIIIFLLSKIHLYNHKQNIQDRLVKIITKEFFEEYDKNFILYAGNVDRVSQQQINLFLEDLNVSKDCMDKLKKITPPKAYSYFGTIVKRWCILYNTKNYKKKIQNSSVEELEEDDKFSYNIDINPIENKLSIFMDSYTLYLSKEIPNIFSKSSDIEIADSILKLFQSRANIDILDKKAIYVYLREMIPGVKTPKITKIAGILGGIFKEKYTTYLETDYLTI